MHSSSNNAWRSGTNNPDGFIELCDGPKTGSPSAADWIAEIKRIWARSPASTLELARAVAAAKTPLRHGQWQEIWKGLPFSLRKADMLAAIGRRLRWVKWQNIADLPVGWSILYELSKLERAAFEEFVRKRAIHPGLKLCEARKLVTQSQGKIGEVKSQRARVWERLRRFEQFVGDNFQGWTEAERELARATLTRLTEQIAHPSNLGLGSAPFTKTAGSSFDTIVLSALDSQPVNPNSFHNL